MNSRRKVAYSVIILLICVGLVAQPAPQGSKSAWHPSWPKLHFLFDRSSPMHALGSIVADIPRAVAGAGHFVSTALAAAAHSVEGFILSPSAHADTSQPSKVSAGGATPQSGAIEVSAKKNRDTWIYANPDGTCKDVFAQESHCESANGTRHD